MRNASGDGNGKARLGEVRAGWRAGRETLETLGRSCETQRPPFEVRDGAKKSARVRERRGAERGDGEQRAGAGGPAGEIGDGWRQGRAGAATPTGREEQRGERGGRPQLGFGAPSSSLPSIFSSLLSPCFSPVIPCNLPS